MAHRELYRICKEENAELYKKSRGLQKEIDRLNAVIAKVDSILGNTLSKLRSSEANIKK